MPLNIEQKKEVVKELNIFAAESVSGAIADIVVLASAILRICAIRQENLVFT